MLLFAPLSQISAADEKQEDSILSLLEASLGMVKLLPSQSCPLILLVTNGK